MTEKSIFLSPFNKRITCCYKCEERTVGCHSSCGKYKKEQEEKAKLYEKIRKERELDLMDAERNINKRHYYRKVGCRK